jgi:hypothetical protein
MLPLDPGPELQHVLAVTIDRLRLAPDHWLASASHAASLATLPRR